jgi:lipopolysaccharide transport system permease protein
MYTLSLHRIKVRYKQSVLGLFWAILQPVAMMLIFTSVFSLIARMPSGPVPYALFAYAAILPWTYFASSVSTATNALVGQAQLVTKVYFPREILPLTYVTVGLFDFLIASLVMIPLMAYYNISPTSQIVWVVPIVIVLTGWITAVSLCLSAIQVRMRDIGVAMPLLLQLWMFASPVIYALSSVPARFRW